MWLLLWGALLLTAWTARAGLVLNELKVNPPGADDAPNEFIEIRGPADANLTNIYLLAIDGESGGNPGRVTCALDLSGARLGSSGLLVVVATNHPYTIPPSTTIVITPELNEPGGGLGNGTISFLLVSTPAAISKGQDLDRGDNGVLEGLPAGATVLDAVGWSDGGSHDLVYGGVRLVLANATPDAATRFPGNDTPNSAGVWFYGNLAGSNGDSVVYARDHVSTNFPPGTLLTPGALNHTAPTITQIMPVSGVIGDPSNPTITFSAQDVETVTSALTISATSTNPGVVPNTNLIIAPNPDGSFTLVINPTGVGYSDISLWVSDGAMTGRVTFPYAASAPGRVGGAWHIGASDGSTAVAINSDYMLVGDDENQIIRLYRRRESGLPTAQFDMTPFLDLPDAEAGVPREVDIEASTRVGNRVFWMGSHSHANIGEIRTNRTRIWATDLSGSGAAMSLTYVGRYDFLKLDLINWDKTNAHGKGTNYYGLEASDADGVLPKAPDGSGFAMEGLAMMPGSTNGAYVAFRAPIVPATNRNYALIVPVLNFATLAASGGTPGSAVFGAPIELDLYGRGIRSLEGNTNGYVLIGGPAAALPGEYPHDFKLYTWTGHPADKPQQRAADLSGLNPEGIVELPPAPWTTNSQVQLVSDNGLTVYYGDDVKAKNLPFPNFKKCRSDMVAFGAVVKPSPIITAVTRAGATFTIHWRALKGETYRVQSAADSRLADWTDLPGEVIATEPDASKVVDLSGPRCFYRIALTPNPDPP
ncbi:MAG: DUF3616 domain-containing protein [Limisphaerales bacterium]